MSAIVVGLIHVTQGEEQLFCGPSYAVKHPLFDKHEEELGSGNKSLFRSSFRMCSTKMVVFICVLEHLLLCVLSRQHGPKKPLIEHPLKAASNTSRHTLGTVVETTF